MPSPPPSTILHESLTSGTETCFHPHSDFLLPLYVVIVYLFDFRLLAYTRVFFEEKGERDFTFTKEEEGGSWRLDGGGSVTNVCFLMLSWYLYLIDILGF